MARYRVGLETRQRILDATRSLLAEIGLEGTTLKAVCDQAEVGAGSFYNLFDSKDDAVMEVVGEAIRAVDPHPDGQGRDTVEELVDAYVRFITADPTLAKIYLQMAVGGGLTDETLGQRVLGHHHNRTNRFAEAISREHPGLAQTEVCAAAEAMLATLNGLAFRWLLDADLDFDSQARRLLKRTPAG